MKRGWLAIALLAAMVALAAWHACAMTALTGGLTDALEQAENLAEAGDWDGARQATMDAQSRWDDAGFHLHVTLDHAVVDEVSAGFAETLEFLELREAGEYSAANARLMERLELLGEMERPSPENLL